MEGTEKSCCEWLVEQNRFFLIRDEHWEKVFDDIEKDINSFSRYYGLFRAKLDTTSLVDMCTALMINDELYAFSRRLTEQSD